MLDVETVLSHAILSLLSLRHEEGSIYGLCVRLLQILFESIFIICILLRVLQLKKY
jgi:hypothetical protein